MAVEVTLMIASVGSWIVGSGTSSTLTSRFPCQTRAFTSVLLASSPAMVADDVVACEDRARWPPRPNLMTKDTRSPGDNGDHECLPRHALGPGPRARTPAQDSPDPVGKVGVGSDFPISVQSMTTTPTTDVNATLQQIAELTATGCDIVRVACPSQDDAEALPAIRPEVTDPGHRRHPLPAQVRLRGHRRRVRRRPRQPGQHPPVRRPGRGDRTPRQGSGRLDPHRRQRRLLDKRLLEKYGKATPEALVESAVWEASLFEEHDFHDFKISVKHNDPVTMVRAL